MSAHPLQRAALYILFFLVSTYFTWLTIEHTIKKIAQGEGVTEIDSTR